MRRTALTVTFCLLIAAVYGLWQHRFERDPRFPPVGIRRVVLSHDPAGPPVVLIPLTPGGAVDFLRVRYQVSATDLAPGAEIWSDGRCIIEWHAPDAPAEFETDQFASMRHSETSARIEKVVRPLAGPAVPVLRLEHLGLGGQFELREFEAVALRERPLWKAGRWFLAGGWLAWAALGFRPTGRHSAPRALAAGAVWLFMAAYFVIPGPWKTLHAMGGEFETGAATRPAVELAVPARAAAPAPASGISSLGELPDTDDITLRIKRRMAEAKPLLHAPLLFAPAFLIACLVGRRRMLAPMIVFALLIEAAQMSFGYGFDRLDVLDLTCDALGIAAATAAHRWLSRSAIFQRISCQPALPLEQRETVAERA